MGPLDESQLERVAVILTRLGAEPSQAKVMASQLMKRAGQVAQEQGISEVEALQNLLKQVIEARQGS